MVFVVWKVAFHFWPLPDPFDARLATGAEIAQLLLGWGLFFVWFGGLLYVGLRTAIRLAEPRGLDGANPVEHPAGENQQGREG